MTLEASLPVGLKWRSSTLFICTTVGIGAFTDMFLYGLIVPVLPFMLQDRIHLPDEKIQTTISILLAIYAAASCLASPITGVLADKLASSRQLPFLLGLILLLLSTVLLAVGQSVPILALARLLQGASGGVVWTIGLALIVETVGQKNLGKTIGTIFSFCSVAALFAPIVGGLIYAKTGYAGVFGLGVALLVIDFVMRLLMIEKRVAAKYISEEPLTSPSSDAECSDSDTPNEQTSLLPPSSSPEPNNPYNLPPPTTHLTTTFPLLLTLRTPALPVALLMGLIQALLLGSFDATVPLVASQHFSFNSLSAGLLFFPLGAADFFLGPVFGYAVDRWGTRPVSVGGFAFLVPALASLRLPFVAGVKDGVDKAAQIALYACLLAANGMGLAVINSTSIVESGNVLDKYFKANRELFGHQPPYAQLYGLNSMMWSAGLTVGPLISGVLRERIGYGGMNAVLAGICAVTAGLAWWFVGRR